MKKNIKLTENIAECQEIETAQSPDCRVKKLSLKKELAGVLCLVLALVVFCSVAAAVVTPKRHDYGAVWGMYKEEPKNSVDVLFFGSSMAYCDIVPSVIYEQSGVTSFVMAGPEQTIPVTYYYLKESCKTQQPKTVFVEATGLIYGESNRSVKINLTYMPWGLNRLIPTFTEKLTEGGETEEETAKLEQSTRLGLLFPLYSYHDRWDELHREDLKIPLLGYGEDELAGYTFLDRVTKIDEFTVREACTEVYDRNLSYIEKMVNFCNDEGINIVFFFSPTTKRLTDDVTAQIKSDISLLGAEFIDFNDNFDEFNFDLSVDFHDTLHTNYRGAQKFSKYLAGIFSDYGLSASENADTELWQERIDSFNKLRDDADSAEIKYNPGVDPNQ